MKIINSKEIVNVSGGGCVENWFTEIDCVCYDQDWNGGVHYSLEHDKPFDGNSEDCIAFCKTHKFNFEAAYWSYHTSEDSDSCGTFGSL